MPCDAPPRRPPRPACSRARRRRRASAPRTTRSMVNGVDAGRLVGPRARARVRRRRRAARCAAPAGRGTAARRRSGCPRSELAVEHLGDGRRPPPCVVGVDGRRRQRRDAAVARRRVHDVARVAVLEHPRHEGVDAVDDAAQVHGEGPAPVVERVLPDLALGADADAGVVAQHVHRPVGGVRLVAQRAPPTARSLTSVTTPVTSWPAARSSATVSSSGSAKTSASTTFMPSRGEALAERPADAAAAAGDDRDPAGELLHQRRRRRTRAAAKAGQRSASSGMSSAGSGSADLGRRRAELRRRAARGRRGRSRRPAPRCRRPWPAPRPRAPRRRRGAGGSREYGQQPSRCGKSLPHMIRSTPTACAQLDLGAADEARADVALAGPVLRRLQRQLVRRARRTSPPASRPRRRRRGAARGSSRGGSAPRAATRCPAR